MGIIFVRTIIIFITLLVVMRLMGKRQIGEMQPYELVITLLIAELACIPMGDPSIPLTYGLTAIITIFFLHQLVCLFDLRFRCAKKIVSGRPSVVINKNGIDNAELKNNNLDISDLIESLRIAGYFSFDAVDYALYESQGTFSALPKPDYEERQTSLPVVIVDEGKFDAKNLQLTKRDESYFRNALKTQGCEQIDNVLVLTVDGNGKSYLQEKNKKYKTFDLGWEESLW